MPAGPFDSAPIRALTFDVGGTVFDWHGTIRDALTALARERGVEIDAAGFANRWRSSMLEAVGQVRAGAAPWMNADAINRLTLDAVLVESPLASLSPSERDRLSAVWHRLRAWPDAAPAIARLRRRYPVVVVSLLNFSLLVDASRAAGLTWDGMISCEFIGRYKDDPLVYETAARWLDLKPEQVLMVAAHAWDLHGARQVGMRTAFVPRVGEWGLPEERDLTADPAFDVVADGFADLAEQLGC